MHKRRAGGAYHAAKRACAQAEATFAPVTTLESGKHMEARALQQLAYDLQLGPALAEVAVRFRAWAPDDAGDALLKDLRVASSTLAVRVAVETLVLSALRTIGTEDDDVKGLRNHVPYGPQPQGGVIHMPPNLTAFEARTTAPPAQVAVLFLLWLALLPDLMRTAILTSAVWAAVGGLPTLPDECTSKTLHIPTPRTSTLLTNCAAVLRTLHHEEGRECFKDRVQDQRDADTEDMGYEPVWFRAYEDMTIFPFEDMVLANTELRARDIMLYWHLASGWAALPMNLMRASDETRSIASLEILEAELYRVVRTTGCVLQRNVTAAVAKLQLIKEDLRRLRITSQLPELTWLQVMIGELPTHESALCATFVSKLAIQPTRLGRRGVNTGPAKGWRAGKIRACTAEFLSAITHMRETDRTNGAAVDLLGKIKSVFARALPPCVFTLLADVSLPNSRQISDRLRFKLKRKMYLMRTLRTAGMEEVDATWVLEVMLCRSKPETKDRDGGDRFHDQWKAPPAPGCATSCLSLQTDPLFVCPWVDQTRGMAVLTQYVQSGNHVIPDLEDMFTRAQQSSGRVCSEFQRRCTGEEDQSFMSPMRWTHHD